MRSPASLRHTLDAERQHDGSLSSQESEIRCGEWRRQGRRWWASEVGKGCERDEAGFAVGGGQVWAAGRQDRFPW